MLWTIAIILLILWILGMVTSTTFGGLVHILIVIAIIVVVVQLLRGRRTCNTPARYVVSTPRQSIPACLPAIWF